jgi:hypothetical protein
MERNPVHGFDQGYRRLKAFFAFYNANYRDLSGLPPDLQPVPLLERQEHEAPRRAIENLRTMVNAIVAQSFDWKEDRLAEVEAALKTHGIISLSELQKLFSKKYKTIIERGGIANIEEYHMASGIVSNPMAIASRKERRSLENMMAAFEKTEVDRFKQEQGSA